MYIPNAAQLQAPLCDHIQGARKKDKRKIKWTPESAEAFTNCKKAIASAATNTYLSASALLALTTDASDTAIAAALEQFEDDGWKPLGFFSRKLSQAEKNTVFTLPSSNEAVKHHPGSYDNWTTSLNSVPK